MTTSPVTRSFHSASTPQANENDLFPLEKITRMALALFWNRKCEITTNNRTLLNIQPDPQKDVSLWKKYLEVLLERYEQLHFVYLDSSGKQISVSVNYQDMQRQKAFFPCEAD